MNIQNRGIHNSSGIFLPLSTGHDSDELLEFFTWVCWNKESQKAKQTPVKAKRVHANAQQGSLQCQLNTGQRPKLPLVHCVNLQVYIKRSLEKERPSMLSVNSSFCSCNPGRLRWPYLNIQWPLSPDTQRSVLLSRVLVLSPPAWRDSTSLNLAGSHPSSSCYVKLLCSPYTQEVSVLQGTLAPSNSSQQVIFNNAPCRLMSEKPPSLQSISGVKHKVELQSGSLTSPVAKGYRLKAVPVRKSQPWFPTQSPIALLAYKQLCSASIHPRAVSLQLFNSTVHRGFFLCFIHI